MKDSECSLSVSTGSFTLSLSLHLTVADSSSVRQELRRIWRRIARSFVYAFQHSSLAIRRCRLLYHSLHHLLRRERLEGEALPFSTPSIFPPFSNFATFLLSTVIN